MPSLRSLLLACCCLLATGAAVAGNVLDNKVIRVGTSGDYPPLSEVVDGKVVGGPPLDTPQALALHREPKANVERYDGLRAQIAGGRHAS